MANLAHPHRPRSWLVVTRAGPNSLHRRWLTGTETPEFDLLVSDYAHSIAPAAQPGVIHEYRPGTKVRGLAALFDDRPDLLTRYDRIALIDDDIATDATTLNRMFRLCTDHDLEIAQPSLRHDSHFTYAALLAQPGFTLRHVPFVEMMCPVFRAEALARALPLFSMGCESGIDLIWCNLFPAPERAFAVLDACPVHHTRPVGLAKASNGFRDGRRYEDDIAALLDRFDLPWLPCVPYGAIDRSGRYVDAATASGRARLLMASVWLLRALPGPSARSRLRKIMVHWAHLLRARPRNLCRAVPSEFVPADGADDLPAALSVPAS